MTLSQSVEHLYEVFEPYALKPVVGCPHCTSEADDQQLRSRPLRALDASQLERFARKAMTTLGDVDDFRHFLPRLLELLGQFGEIPGAGAGTEAEVLLDKLDYGVWLDWPPHERDAVRQFLLAWWRQVLNSFPGVITAADALCAIAQAENDLREYLAVWQQELRNAVPPARHLADLVVEEIRVARQTVKLANAFWDRRSEQMEEVINWLPGPDNVALIEAAFFKASGEAAEQISLAAQVLANLPISDC